MRRTHRSRLAVRIVMTCLLLPILFGCHSIPRATLTPGAKYCHYLLEDRTWFTSYPTQAGICLGFPAEVLIALPIVVPLIDDSTSRKDPEGYEWEVGWCGCWFFGDIVGTPFLALDELFYGLPRRIIVGGECKGKAQQSTQVAPADGTQTAEENKANTNH